MVLDKFFKEVEDLLSNDPAKLASFFNSPLDNYWKTIKNYTVLGHKFTKEEGTISALYFNNDFKKTISFFNSVFDLMNGNDITQEKHSSFLNVASHHFMRANFDYHYRKKFSKFVDKDFGFDDFGCKSELLDAKRKLFFATEFPLHSYEIMFHHEAINAFVKKENYEMAEKEKKKLDRIILKYYSQSN